MTDYYDPDEWTHDEDGNPEWIGPPKLEPDCYACNDGGYVRAGRLARLVGRRDVRCPSCNPSRLGHWLFVWRYRLRSWWPRRSVEYSDEAPF